MADGGAGCWMWRVTMSEVKKSKGQVFLARSFSTLSLVALVVAVFVSGNAWAFMGVIAFLSIAGSLEFFRMTRLGGIPCEQVFGLGLSVVYSTTVALLFAREGVGAFMYMGVVDALGIAAAVLGTFILQLRGPIDGQKSLVAVATTVLGFLYVPFLFNFMARLCFWGSFGSEAEVPGAWLVLWVVAVSKCTDIGAYCTGSLFGTKKMIPHISPGKTWEGFYGAVLVSMGVGSALYAWKPEELALLGGWSHVLILGFMLCLFTVVGDLAESVIKRSLKVKDSGATLPGIGGALDLIDSLCFTAPVAFLYLMFFG